MNDGSTIYPKFTNPMLCTQYPSPIEIHGINTNGIARIGFNTIGPPKITGSLIPQIPGTTLNLPIDLKCFAPVRNTLKELNLKCFHHHQVQHIYTFVSS